MLRKIYLLPLFILVMACGRQPKEADPHAGHNHTEASEATEDHTGHNHSPEQDAEDHTGHNHDEAEKPSTAAAVQEEDHTGHNHGPAEPAPGGEATLHTAIQFNPAQAQKLGFEHAEATLKQMHKATRTGGVIESASADEQTISATSSGMVRMVGRGLAEGMAVKKGEVLMTISSSDINSDNYTEQYNSAKAAYTKAATDLKRAKELLADKIVSDKEFAAIELEYKQAAERFEALAKNYSTAGKQIVAPMAGYVKKVDVSSGEYVSSGQKLLTISQNRRLVLRADMSQRDYAASKGLSSASFVTPYDGKTYDISKMNGSLLAAGKSTDGGFFVPVKFEFDNIGDIIPGSFVEVILEGESLGNKLTVPIGALVEEQGLYSVYVLVQQNEYEKVFVEPGVNNGFDVEIKAGLKEGDKVVSKGAYFIKLSSMSNEAPAHSH